MESGSEQMAERERCSQSRVGILASTGCGHTALSSNVARGGLGYGTASGDVLDVNQWASVCVDRGWVELEQSHFGVLPRLFKRSQRQRCGRKQASVIQTIASNCSV